MFSSIAFFARPYNVMKHILYCFCVFNFMEIFYRIPIIAVSAVIFFIYHNRINKNIISLLLVKKY